MHEGGCTCREAREWLKKIDRELEKLSEELSDTLLLVTADHGHIKIGKELHTLPGADYVFIGNETLVILGANTDIKKFLSTVK